MKRIICFFRGHRPVHQQIAIDRRDLYRNNSLLKAAGWELVRFEPELGMAVIERLTCERCWRPQAKAES